MLLSNHKNILDLDNFQDENNYESISILIHSWKIFGITPTSITIFLKTIANGKNIALARVQLKQANDLGTNIGIIEIPTSYAVLLAKYYGLAFLLTERDNSLSVLISDPTLDDSDLIRAIRADIITVEIIHGFPKATG